ncbi:MAG: hypothetical protein QG670_2898 [Thermoproteota archaeon]|nr:hypothetical protein [Thermoproteota archaeon]
MTIKATEEEMVDRRVDMLFLDRMGIRSKDWIQEIAVKYSTSPEAVKRDWSRRKAWMRQILKVGDAEELALDVLYDYERALQDAYKLFHDAVDVPDRVQALWARLRVIQMREQYLRSVGALERISIDFRSESEERQERMMEKKYPFMKGQRDSYIRSMALAGVAGEKVGEKTPEGQ